MDFPFTIAPGQTITVSTTQAYLYYEAGSAGGADASIRVAADIGDEIVLKPGQGFRYSGPFSRLYLSNNKGQAPIIGHIVLEAGEFFDNRVTGTVDIVDGGKNRTLAGQTFVMAASNGPAAGQYGVQELWNPAGSGKNVIVEQIQVSSAAASNILCGWTGTRVGAGAAGILSKKAGGANSSAAATFLSLAALPGTFNYLTTCNVQANGTILLPFKEPIVIPPGFGLIIANSTASNSLQMWAEFFEEGI